MKPDSLQNEAHTRRVEALRRALNHDVGALLSSDDVIEIMLNPDGALWVDRAGAGMSRAGQIDAVRAMSIISAVAAVRDDIVTADKPVLECELPPEFAGARFEGLIPPVVARPSFAIRKKALLVYSLGDYVSRGIMSEAQALAIENAVVSRENIIISGGTGTGKTTLANAVLRCMSERAGDDRIVILEDTQELQCLAPNAVFLRTSENVTMTHLLRATMRLRPDRIVVGEVRDAAALALLKAWNTGHPGGIGTVHANSASAALTRIGQLVQEAGVPPAPELIAEAVNIIVSVRRINAAPGRVVDEVLRVAGYSAATGFVFESASA